MKLCGVEQRAPPIFGRAAITLGIGPHSSLFGTLLHIPFCIGTNSVVLKLLPHFQGCLTRKVISILCGCNIEILLFSSILVHLYFLGLFL